MRSRAAIRSRSQWAAAFLIASALSHVFWVFYAYHSSLTVYVIVCGLDLLMLFPAIAGILMSMLQDRKRPVFPLLLALIPALVLLVLCIVRGDASLLFILSTYVIALYGLLMLFMFFSLRGYGRWLRDNYADLENKEVMQSFLILTVFVLFFVLYSSTAEGKPVLLYILQIDCIIIVALLLWRVETLQQLNGSPSQETEPAAPEQEVSSSELSFTATQSRIGALLKEACENRQLYLQHDLTLAQLANAIGTNRTYLSQHFAQQGISYNTYINGLRIRHFVSLYEKAVADKREITAQQLAFESGFHSYSTFSATFKKFMGSTVTAWMRGTEK